MFRSKRKKDVSISDIETQRENLKEIIDGKLYDTSKAKEMATVILDREEIPNYVFLAHSLCGQEVIIYKGNSEWFIVYRFVLQPVSEEWVKKKLGKYNVDKYIELFGEPELA